VVLEKSFEGERTVKGDHGLGRGDVDPDKATFVSEEEEEGSSEESDVYSAARLMQRVEFLTSPHISCIAACQIDLCCQVQTPLRNFPNSATRFLALTRHVHYYPP